MSETWTGLDTEDANLLPADLDRDLAERAFRAVRTFTKQDGSVFVNVAVDDEEGLAAVR